MTCSRRLARECTDAAADRQTSSLAGLAVTLLLVVIGFYLIDVLRTEASVQDCVLSGRISCVIAAR